MTTVCVSVLVCVCPTRKNLKTAVCNYYQQPPLEAVRFFNSSINLSKMGQSRNQQLTGSPAVPWGAQSAGSWAGEWSQDPVQPLEHSYALTTRAALPLSPFDL